MKPPTQYLIGSKLTIWINEDTAPKMQRVRLQRRARRRLHSGVISGRIEKVWYEILKDGRIYRVDEDGERKRVPDGHAEWRWAADAQNWLWQYRFRGRNVAGSPPPDLIAWEIAATETEG